MNFIEEQANKYPELSEEYSQIGDLFNRKLYHQLSEKLDAFVNNPNNSRAENFIDLYIHFVRPIEAKLNQLRLVQLVALISRQYKDPLKAVKLLETLAEKEQRLGVEAHLVCLMEIGRYKVTLGQTDDVKTLLEEKRPIVEGLTGAEPVVHASFYGLAATYFKMLGPADAFYKNALMFLAYTDYDQLTAAAKFELATDISLAALSGEGVFNFGEVLATPILKALEGTPNQWLSQLMHAFNRGDIDAFNTIVGTHAKEIQAQPSLVAKEDYIKQKITLLALMELVFHKPAHQRNIPFAEIAEAIRLPLEQVEWVVMRAMSLKLIKGTIDQVEQMVQVTYVQPRVLDNSQIQELTGRLQGWGKNVQDSLLFIEEQTPELF